jgi:hypothetical protein
MTIKEALKAYKAMFPDKADKLAVGLKRKIGYKHGYMDAYYLWDYSGDEIALVQSFISWEDALSQLGDK